MPTQDNLLDNIARFCDYLGLMVDNGIDIDATELQDNPGVKMNPNDSDAYGRAADRARAILLKNGVAI